MGLMGVVNSSGTDASVSRRSGTRPGRRASGPGSGRRPRQREFVFENAVDKFGLRVLFHQDSWLQVVGKAEDGEQLLA